jgi:hypothetical protein
MAISSAAASYLQNLFSVAASGSTTNNSSASSTGSLSAGLFSNLGLTSTEQTQIASILQSSSGLSFSQIESRINGVLTPSQQQTFESDMVSLHSHAHGHHHHGGAGSSSSSNSVDSDTDAFGVQNMTGSSATTATNSIFSDIAAQMSVQSQLNSQNPLSLL